MEELELITYKKEVKDIWKEYDHLSFLNEKGHEYRKSPLLPELVYKNSLLFVGINPSFSVKNSFIAESEKEIGFYPVLGDITKLTKEDKRNQIPYFKKMTDIALYCNQRYYSHLDMLFIRETDQSKVRDLAYTDRGSEFVYKQIKIIQEIINKMMPKAILVSNAFASELLGKKKSYQTMEEHWLGYELDFKNNFDDTIGTYRIPIGDKKTMTPIVFSGMLSGQRSLDIGSLERLKWQIKRILDNP